MSINKSTNHNKQYRQVTKQTGGVSPRDSYISEEFDTLPGHSVSDDDVDICLPSYDNVGPEGDDC